MNSEKHTKLVRKKRALNEMISDALKQLQKLDYDERSIRRYESTWKRLIIFTNEHKFENKLSEKLIVKFLEHHDIKPTTLSTELEGWKKHTAYSIKILWQYTRYGYFERLRARKDKLMLPPAMEKILNEYEVYCREGRHYSYFSINEAFIQLSMFLDFLGTRNIDTYDAIKAIDLTEFVTSLGRYSAKSVSRIVSNVRVFLRFLFSRDLIKKDISQVLPTIRIPRYATIPSVWDTELLEKLLMAVDRGSPKGKRDYAIFLLACRLGLRVSDILALTLDNINWEAAIISIIQTKTKQPLTLPLTEEVGNALIDYLSSGRPNVDYREVFIRVRPPLIPFSKNTHLYALINYWRNRAGIKFHVKQRSGMHSLRHTLATQLLGKDTSFQVIASILGHSSINSCYRKVKMSALR